MIRVGRALFALLAAAVLGGMVAKAALDVSWPWDVWYYHLPFAGRIWGLLPASAYILTPLDEARFAGYPLLAETLQGLAWKLVGRPEAANFVSLAALASLILYARLRLRISWFLATLALVAIPLVQIHATSCYIDLPANAALAVVVLEAIRAWRLVPGRRSILGVVVAGTLAGNMRLQLEPILLGALVFLGVSLGRAAFARRGPGSLLLILVLASPLIFAWPLKNAVLHHNPAYPVALHLAGHELPFVEEAYDSSPPYLQGAARPWRWLVSLAEIGIGPLSDSRRWTIDQFMPPDSTGNRMGGFFGAYVAACLAAVVTVAARRGERAPASRPWRERSGLSRRPALVGVALLSLACSLMPQSHELRYYLVWMIVLVLVTCALVTDAAPVARRQLAELVSAAVASGFLLVVLASTRGWHVLPQRYPFEALLRDHVDARVLARLPEGGTGCVARAPWTALYAAPFHPPRVYAVREAERDEDCPSPPATASVSPLSPTEMARSRATVRTSSSSLARSAQR